MYNTAVAKYLEKHKKIIRCGFENHISFTQRPRTKLKIQKAVRYAGICLVTGFFVGIGLAAGVSLFTAVVQRPHIEKAYYADQYGYPNWTEEDE